MYVCVYVFVNVSDIHCVYACKFYACVCSMYFVLRNVHVYMYIHCSDVVRLSVQLVEIPKEVVYRRRWQH